MATGKRTPPLPLLPRRHLLALLLCALLGQAAASATFGVALNPLTGSWPDATFTTSVPFAAVETNRGPLVFAGRLDLTSRLDFAVPPAVGLAATATYTSHDMFRPFYGLGAELGWAGPAEARHLYVTPALLVGMHITLNDNWSARIEAKATPLVGRYALNAGVDVAPW